jgi:hypothetical protein
MSDENRGPVLQGRDATRRFDVGDERGQRILHRHRPAADLLRTPDHFNPA